MIYKYYLLWIWSLIDKSMNYPVMPLNLIRFLNGYLKNDMRIFEYGAGRSTIYFSLRAGEVNSMEHDYYWYYSLLQDASYYGLDRVFIHHKESKEEYLNAIDKIKGKFDIVVVDGKYRTECLQKAPERLRKGGLLILDDSNRYDTRNLDKRFKSKVFGGLRMFSMGNGKGHFESNTSKVWFI